MRNFELLSCGSEVEALDALSVHAEDGKVIAGGVALLIVLKQRLYSPAYLIDIGELSSLRYIREAEGVLSIGAMTPHRVIENDTAVASGYPLLSEAFHRVGTIRIRNQGTIGGNLCFAEPAADPPAALMAMEAELVVEEEGR